MKSKNYLISFITVFFVSCIFYNSYSQDFKRIAEHHLELKNAQNDSAKITALTKLAHEYSSTNLDSTLKYGNRAISIAKNSNRFKGIVYSYNSIGDAFWYKGNYSKAQEYYFNSYRISDSICDKASMALSLYSMGWILCIQQGDSSKLNYFYQAKNIYKGLHNTQGEIQINDALTSYYIEKYKQIKNTKCYFDSALYYINCTKIILNNTHKQLGLPYYSYCILFYYASDYKSSKFYGDQALPYYDKNKKIINHYEILLYIGLSELKMNEKEKAFLKIKEAYNYFKQQEYKEYELLSLNGFSEYYYLSKDYKRAYDYGIEYFNLKAELDNQKNSSQLSNLKNNYETGKTNNKLNQLEQEKELEEQRNKTKNYLLIAVFAGIIAVLGFVYSLRKQNLQKHEANKILEDKNHIIEEKQKEILDSINYAKRIQDSLLASSELIKTYLPNSFVYFNPKDIVSGDFYWATEHNNYLYLAICDSTGHGVPGAFMSFLNMAYLSEAINEKNISEPHNILNYVRTRLVNTISKEGQSDGMDGILFKIEKTNNITNIEYSAANNHPILITNNQLLEQPKDKMPIGKGEKYDSFMSHSITVKTGDALYLYTDGYADQFGGEKGKKFKYKPLNELLISIHHLPMQEQKNILSTTFAAWKGQLEQIDDVLIFGIVI